MQPLHTKTENEFVSTPHHFWERKPQDAEQVDVSLSPERTTGSTFTRNKRIAGKVSRGIGSDVHEQSREYTPSQIFRMGHRKENSNTSDLEYRNAVPSPRRNESNRINTKKRPVLREMSLWGKAEEAADDDGTQNETLETVETGAPLHGDKDAILEKSTATESVPNSEIPNAVEDDFYGAEPEEASLSEQNENTETTTENSPRGSLGTLAPSAEDPLVSLTLSGSVTSSPLNTSEISSQSESESGVVATRPSITATFVPGAKRDPTLESGFPSGPFEENLTNQNTPLVPSFFGDRGGTSPPGGVEVGNVAEEAVPNDSTLPLPTETGAPTDETLGSSSEQEAIINTSAPEVTEPASKPTAAPAEPLEHEGITENISFSESKPSDAMIELEKEEKEKEKEEFLEEELVREEREVRRIGGFGVFLAIVAMVFTAHQMSENPDGIYASCCRLILTLIGCGFKIVFMPFRSAVGGNRGYGHLPVNTMDYGYRDPYRPGASNSGSMELS